MFPGRVDENLASGSAPRIVLRNIGRSRGRVHARRNDTINHKRVPRRLRAKAQRPFHLKRISNIDVIIDDNGKFSLLIHQRPGAPGDFFDLLGVFLLHGDDQHAACSAAFGEVHVLVRQPKDMTKVMKQPGGAAQAANATRLTGRHLAQERVIDRRSSPRDASQFNHRTLAAGAHVT